jgi:GAF domain-containing protein
MTPNEWPIIRTQTCSHPSRRHLGPPPMLPIAAAVRDVGIRSAVGAPIDVDGRLWGAAVIASSGPEPHDPPTEARLADFAELVATAIANAQARDELIASRARIVAAGDEARRRIERDLHDGAQQRLVTLREFIYRASGYRAQPL